jgi:hypothetical protein
MSEAKPMTVLKAIKIHAPAAKISGLPRAPLAYTVCRSDATT